MSVSSLWSLISCHFSLFLYEKDAKSKGNFLKNLEETPPSKDKCCDSHINRCFEQSSLIFHNLLITKIISNFRNVKHTREIWNSLNIHFKDLSHYVKGLIKVGSVMRQENVTNYLFLQFRRFTSEMNMSFEKLYPFVLRLCSTVQVSLCCIVVLIVFASNLYDV